MSPQELRVIFFFASPGFLHEFSRILSALGPKINKKLVVQNSNSTISTCAKSTTMSTSEEELQRKLLMHDNYFMDLENYTLTKVGLTVGEQAMSMKKDRGGIPEWMNAIAENIDYNLGGGEAHKQVKLALYRAWVLRGHGDDWFVEDGH